MCGEGPLNEDRGQSQYDWKTKLLQVRSTCSAHEVGHSQVAIAMHHACWHTHLSGCAAAASMISGADVQASRAQAPAGICQQPVLQPFGDPAEGSHALVDPAVSASIPSPASHPPAFSIPTWL